MTDVTEVYGAVKRRERRVTLSIDDVSTIEVEDYGIYTEIRLLDERGKSTGTIIEVCGVGRAPKLHVIDEEDNVIDLRRSLRSAPRPNGGDAA